MIPFRTCASFVRFPILRTLQPLLSSLGFLNKLFDHGKAVLEDQSSFSDHFCLVECVGDGSALIDKLKGVLIVFEANVECEIIIVTFNWSDMIYWAKLLLDDLLHAIHDLALIALVPYPHVFVDDMVFDIRA
jgi:hypothetical protein